MANMEQINSSINASLSKQITDNLADIRQKVTAIAEKNGVTSEYVDAIMQDYEAVLMDKYTFLNMTPQLYDAFMTTGGTNTPDKWLPLMNENRAINLLFNEYRLIGSTIYTIKQHYKDVESMTEEELLHVTKTIITEDKTAWQVARSEVLNYFGQCSIDMHDTAVIYKHIECLIALRRYFITTNEDLLPIKPINCAPLLSEELQKHNKTIIKQSDETMPKAAERKQKKQQKQKDITIHPHMDMDAVAAPKAERHKIYTDTSERQPKKDKTIPIYQNVLETLNTEIQTSWQNERGGLTDLVPLRNALNIEGMPQTTQTYALQALKGIAILPHIGAKVAEDGTYITYHITLQQFVQIAGGVAKPNNDITKNLYNGLILWSKLFIPLVEWRGAYVRKKNGKIVYPDKWKRYEVMTQPITATFGSEGKLFESDGSISGRTELDIRLHRAFVEGRREHIAVEGKQKMLIRQPCRYFLQLSQYQLFDTPEGINFQRIIMYCDRRTEYKQWNENKANDILADVFGYRSRLQGKTGEELQKEKTNIRTNKPRDKKTLANFFKKAKEGGFIADYEKKPAANGEDYVWTWKRTIKTEDAQPLLTIKAEA